MKQEKIRQILDKLLDREKMEAKEKHLILAGALEGLAGEIRRQAGTATKIQRQAWYKCIEMLKGDI